MGEWENGIFGLIKDKEWLDVGFRVTRPNDPIDGLIRDTRTDDIIVYWKSLASQYQIPVMAQFHAFDSVTRQTMRVPMDTHNVEKGLIKVSIPQSERLRELLNTGVRESALTDYVLQDGVRLADQVITRTKVAKNELLATGKVTIKENNLDLTVDYGVPTEQTAFTLTLGEDDDIPAQLEDIVEAAKENGVTLTGMLTSGSVISKMRRNSAIQKAVNGNIGAGALVRNEVMRAYLDGEYGLSRVVVNDLIYSKPLEMGEDGRPIVEKARYYPKDKVTFFATNPAGYVGEGLWGDPPEAGVGAFTSLTQASEKPYVYVSQWATPDPVITWTKASALFMPALYTPSSLYIASVTTAGG